jgi:DNA gyrase subunit A
VPLASYENKTNRKKLIKAYCDKYTIHTILHVKEETELLLKSTNGRMLIVNTASIPAKTTKDNGGIGVMTQKKGQRILDVSIYDNSLSGDHRYRTRNLPAAGSKMPAGEGASQEMLDI